MLDIPMKMHHHSKGPSITMQIYAHDDKITQSVLYPHHETGIKWQIIADHAYPKLESMLEDWVEAYCSSDRRINQLPLYWSNISPFTAKVLNAIHNIPFGEVITYRDLADRIGNPKAARPVGSACGRNPFPLIVPCHRVLAEGSHIGGYSLDLIIKKRLLAFEGIDFKS